jgi:RNA polymerase sigma factor (sigma-70 family)
MESESRASGDLSPVGSDPVVVTTDDALLVTRARTGDTDAYAALFTRHRTRLRRVCASVVGDDDAAADVIQDAALVAWLQLDRLRDPAEFGPWLVGIGRNLALRLVRERSARRRWLVPDTSLLEPIAADTDDPAHRVLAHEQAAELLAAIADLPSGQRDAVVLFHLADLPQRTVASRLNTSAGALRTRLHKARTSLRTRLTATHDHPEPLMPDTATPAQIIDVRRTPAGRHVVLLTTEDHEIPIWVGAAEAEALAIGLQDVELPRPNAHALALALVHACGRSPARIRISRLDAAIFYAEVILDDGTAVDARPSDALVLAVAAGVPIEIDAAVVVATRNAPPDSYAQDLAQSPSGGAALIAQEVRSDIAARADEIRKLLAE